MCLIFSHELVSWWWMIRYCFPLLVLRQRHLHHHLSGIDMLIILEQSVITLFSFNSHLIIFSVKISPACICRRCTAEGNQKSRNSFRYNFSLGDLQIRIKYHCLRIHNKSFRINGIVTHAKLLCFIRSWSYHRLMRLDNLV